jgi:hypothetical protein
MLRIMTILPVPAEGLRLKDRLRAPLVSSYFTLNAVLVTVSLRRAAGVSEPHIVLWARDGGVRTHPEKARKSGRHGEH